MNHNVELLPGTPIEEITTGRRGEAVAPPKGGSVGNGMVWADLGSGPEQVPDQDVDILKN